MITSDFTSCRSLPSSHSTHHVSFPPNSLGPDFLPGCHKTRDIVQAATYHLVTRPQIIRPPRLSYCRTTLLPMYSCPVGRHGDRNVLSGSSTWFALPVASLVLPFSTRARFGRPAMPAATCAAPPTMSLKTGSTVGLCFRLPLPEAPAPFPFPKGAGSLKSIFGEKLLLPGFAPVLEALPPLQFSRMYAAT